MGKEYLFGLDIGTEGSKGVITDLSGDIVSQEYRSHDVGRPRPGWAEHDAERIWWQDFKAISRSILEKASVDPKTIAAVGCSGLSPDMLPVDRRGSPLRPAILYGIDARTTREIEWLNERIGSRRIRTVGGAILSTQSVGPKILWFKKHEPDRFAVTSKFLTATSYLVYKLTGKYAIDYCNAMGFTPLFNFMKLEWDEDMCNVVGITADKLPRLYPAAQVIGKVTTSASQETGLSEGTPVVTGTGDFAAEILSTGVGLREAALINGSTALIFGMLEEPVFHPSLFLFPPVLGGMYMVGGAMATSGAITRWFRDNFGQVEVKSGKKRSTCAYEILSQEAEQVPLGSGGLVVLPYFSGERSPIFDENARGLILGLTLSHTRAHIYRAILEGVAYGVKHHLEIMEEVGFKVDEFVSAGGGTRSDLWVKIMSDVTGIKQRCVSKFVGSPIGDAYLAGYGVGIFRDLNPLREVWVKTKKTVHPEMQNHKRYREYYKIYRRLYPDIKEDMHVLATLALQSP